MKLKKFNEEWSSPKDDENKTIVNNRLDEIEKRDIFVGAMSTLFYSWGGDTPQEAFWAANEFLKYYELVNGVELPRVNDWEDSAKVINAIKRSK